METLNLKNMICALCPNGCHLLLDEKDSHQIEVKGNRCIKGKSFVKKELIKQGMRVDALTIVSYEIEDNFSFEELGELFAQWGHILKKIHPKTFIEGSPERTEYRVVLEDTSDQWFVLERIAPAMLDKKKRIIDVLHFLNQEQLPFIKPYSISKKSENVVKCDSGLWQLSPFVRGVPLNREQYIYEGWRAPLLADFLMRMRKKTTGIIGFENDEPFSLREYVQHLAQQVRKHHPELIVSVNPMVTFCENDLFKEYDQIPTVFCHGDYHPLNIIWGRHQIKAVIDWEFCGFKPEIYDVCNMIGCLGMEHPSSLRGELVMDFISMLREQSSISEKSWKLLVDFIVALRFAWLSEWLRKEDKEMIDLELDYMTLLIENKQALLELWEIS